MSFVGGDEGDDTQNGTETNMLALTLKINGIDHNGFTGRTLHPTDDMIGQDAQVMKMEQFCESGEPMQPANDSQNHGMYPYTVFLAQLSDGRLVELIDTEIEVVVCQEQVY
jgi:hypothetical protein